MKEQRNYSFDLIRVIAIILIILMHSPIPGSETSGVVLSGISFITAPGIGLFLMISGALLLNNAMSQTFFLKRRFSKIIYPTVVWAVIYLLNKYLTESISVSNVFKSILSIPFSAQGHGVLWFMYTLAGLYLLTPILSVWLKNVTQQEVRFYLIIWGISLLYPYLSLFLEINTEPTGIFYYFSGYVGYFILGYYLNKWVLTQKITRKTHFFCWIIMVLCISIVGVLKLLYPNISINDYFWYLSLPVAMMSTSYFILLSQVHILHFKNLFVKLSSLSFGVYLCHILVMRSFLWKIPFVVNSGPILHIFIVTIFTIIISWLLSWLISKLTFSKYIIGI